MNTEELKKEIIEFITTATGETMYTYMYTKSEDEIVDFLLSRMAADRKALIEEGLKEVEFELKRFEDKATIINFDSKDSWIEYRNGLRFVISFFTSHLEKLTEKI